jgi:hypothetical protein
LPSTHWSSWAWRFSSAAIPPTLVSAADSPWCTRIHRTLSVCELIDRNRNRRIVFNIAALIFKSFNLKLGLSLSWKASSNPRRQSKNTKLRLNLCNEFYSMARHACSPLFTVVKNVTVRR